MVDQEKPKDYRIRLNREELDFLGQCLAYAEAGVRAHDEKAPDGHLMAYQLKQRLLRPGSARRW